MEPSEEPQREVVLDGRRITLLGTAHVSRASAEKVRELLETHRFDAVAVELCPSRYHALLDPEALARMDLFRVLKEGKAAMVAANLALGAYQQRLADQFGIEPGAEQRAAVRYAKEHHRPVLLIDREIGVTLRRVAHNLPWWQRWTLFSGLAGSLFSREEVSEEEIERLKEGDMLETTFAEFAAERRELYLPLIDERDRYMAARLHAELGAAGYREVLVVIGAGHLKGVEGYLRQAPGDAAAVLRELDGIPPPAVWPRVLPWLIVAVILAGFALGFARNPELGWRMVFDWIWINGGLAALGAAIAGGHPLSVVTAFVAAPFTSLNPTIGAGMVTAAAEIYLRRPQVGDFSALRRDTTTLGGWWRNRVSRTLLVFLFSTLGSAIGTYVAGFLIYGRLAG
jgi:pheromone shutdown-related protein TraB